MDAAKLEIVTFRGTPRARGRAHGEYFAERIGEPPHTTDFRTFRFD